MKTLDRIFGCLMFLGGIGHGLGSYKVYHNDHMALLWALSASFATFLLASMNLLRTARPSDRTLAWLCVVGSLIQIIFATSFGLLIGNVLDFRPLVNLVIAVVLALFSLRAAFQSALRPAPQDAN